MIFNCCQCGEDFVGRQYAGKQRTGGRRFCSRTCKQVKYNADRKATTPKKECQSCSSLFVARNRRQIFCKTCKRKTGPYEKKCIQCGTSFLARRLYDKFCCRDCHRNYLGRVQFRDCVVCGTRFEVVGGPFKTCSLACQVEQQKRNNKQFHRAAMLAHETVQANFPGLNVAAMLPGTHTHGPGRTALKIVDVLGSRSQLKADLEAKGPTWEPARKCLECGADFCPASHEGTCSDECNQARVKRQRAKVLGRTPRPLIINCKACGIAFRAMNSAVTCSPKCSRDWKAIREFGKPPRPLIVDCKVCGSPFRPGSNAVTCSPECSRIYKSQYAIARYAALTKKQRLVLRQKGRVAARKRRGNILPVKKCVVCGTKFVRKYSNQKFCSPGCRPLDYLRKRRLTGKTQKQLTAKHATERAV